LFEEVLGDEGEHGVLGGGDGVVAGLDGLAFVPRSISVYVYAPLAPDVLLAIISGRRRGR
jgi:hypothetical protein